MKIKNPFGTVEHTTKAPAGYNIIHTYLTLWGVMLWQIDERAVPVQGFHEKYPRNYSENPKK